MLAPIVWTAVDEYTRKVGLADSDPMDHSFEIWEGRGGHDLARVTLEAGGKPLIEYVLGESWSDECYINIERDSAGEDAFICK